MSIKLKWALIVGVFLIIGGIAMIVGFEMAGYDVIAWFGSKYAIYVYVCAGAYLMMIGSFIIKDYVMK